MSKIPKHGAWYTVIPITSDDFSFSWGYILYLDGEEIERVIGYTNSRRAEDAGRTAVNKINKSRKENR
jgi:hypothetical protein